MACSPQHPSFLIPGGGVGEERVTDVHTEGKESDVDTEEPHLKKSIST